MTRPILAVTLVGLALAVPGRAAPEVIRSTMTIRLVSTTTAVRVLRDKTPKNTVSPGDVIRERSALRNAVAQFGRPKGALVGSDLAIFTIVSARRVDVKVTATLPGGTIRSAGRTGVAGAQDIQVIGGTGTFAGARGVGEVHAIAGSPPGVALNVYRLRLP